MQPASRVARAATRYRPGKAPVGLGDTYSSDEGEADSPDGQPREEEAAIAKEEVTLGRGYAPIRTTVEMATKKEEEEVDSSEYETDTDDDDDLHARTAPSYRAPAAGVAANKRQSASEEEESTDESESSSSEEDVKARMVKPIFKSKRDRETAAAPSSGTAIGGEILVTVEEEVPMESERKKQSHLLAAARIRQEMQEREDRESKPDLDDTDGLDPEAEFQAWRTRELARVQRERDADRQKEEERIELERRKAMPESERLKEDLQRARQSHADKRRGGGEQGFMQKYYHKGSFFQDAEVLQNRDFTGKTESAVDKTMLPKMMQVRDYGKKGRSKWTHLANEDTSRQDSARACHLCGGAHLQRDCPRSTGDRPRRRSRSPIRRT